MEAGIVNFVAWQNAECRRSVTHCRINLPIVYMSVQSLKRQSLAVFCN